VFDTADRSDVPQLLRLFRRTHEHSADPEVLSAEIASPDGTFLVARHPARSWP
jgi:hypothetical protein